VSDNGHYVNQSGLKVSSAGDKTVQKIGQVSEKVDRMGGYGPPGETPRPMPTPPPHGLRDTNTRASVSMLLGDCRERLREAVHD
jgi:hypothetical protein